MEAALRYAAAGRLVFPVRDKHQPLTAHGHLDACTDPSTIRRWFARPDAQLAIRTGRESRLVVVDVDPRHGGDDTLHDLEAEHGPLPATASVVTPSGGEHYWFQHPGVEVRNTTTKLGAGVDFRGDGGYALVPPSTGYELDCEAPFAPLPAWLLALLREPSANGEWKRTPVGVWTAIVSEGVSEGQRHDQLVRIVGHLLGHGVDPALVRELAQMVGRECRPPHDRADIDRVVDDLAAAEHRKRWSA